MHLHWWPFLRPMPMPASSDSTLTKVMADIPCDLASPILEIVKLSRLSLSTKLPNVLELIVHPHQKLGAENQSEIQRIWKKYNE
jgi:hypothetical protein